MVRQRLISFLFLVLSSHFSFGQAADPARLTLDRIFESEDFHPEPGRSRQWLDAQSYAELQPSTTHKGASDLVRVDVASGKKEVLVPAEKLIPDGSKEPLKVEGYALSKDLGVVLV